jgi:peptidoglycan/xylan/chitin deacetylase (PgdA/CDA1 family)
MRLLLITNVFPMPWEPTRGVFNDDLVRQLARAHEVRVVCPVPWLVELKRWRAGGVSPLMAHNSGGLTVLTRQVVREGVEVHYPRFWYPPRMLRTWYGWFLRLSVERTVRRLLRAAPPDAVLGYWAHPDGEVAVRTARRAGVPAVVMIGGSDILLLARNSARRRCITRVLQAADAVIAMSQNLRDRVRELGVSAAKVHVVHRGVDPDLFFPGDRREARRKLGLAVQGPLVLWVGRMVPVKGLDVLLEAWARVRRAQQAGRLWLVGDGPLRSALEARAQQADLAGAVAFAGPIAHARLGDWYRAADLTVLPSRSEGVPNVLRESLACGTPFVASRVGGIPEIATDPQRQLVEPNDPDALARAITRALSESSSACDHSRTIADSAAELIEIIRPLVARAASQRRAADELNHVPPGFHPAPSRWRQAIRWTLARVLPRQLYLLRGPRDSRAVCLTFDDGPHPEHTPRLLDALGRAGVPATFFVVGQEAERYPDLVRRMVAEGHVVGHHTFTHLEPGQATARQLIAEVDRTQALLADLLGRRPTLFRPPRGKVTASLLWRLWRLGQTVVLWNVDPRDYACPSSEELAGWFRRSRLSGGDVVLMHDNRPHAAAVLADVVDAVRGCGLEFATPLQWAR